LKSLKKRRKKKQLSAICATQVSHNRIHEIIMRTLLSAWDIAFNGETCFL